MCKKRFSLTAIIYDKRGKVLSIGKNSYVKTHPVQAEWARKAGEAYKQVLHAEIAAIIKCTNLAKAYRISVFRYKEDGSPANAKPCKTCAGAIAKTSIKIIEHT
jgi:deoxycytidylate deaminase